MQALGKGRQTMILRKGGIAEEGDGFVASHADFWLLPTRFHAQPDKIRPEFRALVDERKRTEPQDVELRFVAKLLWTRFLEDWGSVGRLVAFQTWEEEVLRERFAYGGKAGLHLLMMRVYRSERVVLPWERGLGGCRSWVKVGHSWNERLTPVLPDAEFLLRERAVRAAVEGEAVERIGRREGEDE